MPEIDNHHEIRAAVRKLCEDFPGEYWRKLDEQRAYPEEFVAALTEAGYLSVLIPEEYGGVGLTLSAAAAVLEEIQRAGCNGGACHAQMYVMGTVLRHGSEAQKAKYLPGIASGELRMQAFGVTEPTSGTDTTSIRTFAKRDGGHYVVNDWRMHRLAPPPRRPRRRASGPARRRCLPRRCGGTCSTCCRGRGRRRGWGRRGSPRRRRTRWRAT